MQDVPSGALYESWRSSRAVSWPLAERVLQPSLLEFGVVCHGRRIRHYRRSAETTTNLTKTTGRRLKTKSMPFVSRRLLDNIGIERGPASGERVP